jgi:hypothetical protein
MAATDVISLSEIGFISLDAYTVETGKTFVHRTRRCCDAVVSTYISIRNADWILPSSNPERARGSTVGEPSLRAYLPY